MTERLIAGALAAIALSITALVIGLFLAIYRGGPGVTETISLWSAMPKLLLLVSTIGFFVGAALGPIRAVHLLSHLWGTAQPRRTSITVLLWVALIVLWVTAFNLRIAQ
jgi:hypothetical protein